MSRKPPPGPARSLELLWGSQTKPGRSGLTVLKLIEAAVALCDDEGLAALSMRQVAERLGVGTMSLYTYVPGKDELTDLMFDYLMGQVYENVDEPSRQGGWADAVRFIVRKNWALLLAHPWLPDMVKPRPVFGPRVLLKYEAELRPLEGIGLTDVEMDTLLAVLTTHVQGAARTAAHLQREAHNSAQNDLEWWLDLAPLLETRIDPKRFPIASRVGKSFGDELQVAAAPEWALEFGLERLIGGLEALLASRSRA